MAGPVFWAADDTTNVLRFYRDFATAAPDELGSVVRLGTIPPLPDIPEDLHWRPAIAVACCYAGAVEDGERAVRALRRLGTPLVDLLAPTPYAAHQGSIDDTVLHGWHYYWKAANLAGLSDNAIAVIADHAYTASSPRSYAAIFHMGGAVARVPHDATAYAGRDVAHNIIIDAVWLPDESGEHAAAETSWARRFLQALQPHRRRLRQLPRCRRRHQPHPRGLRRSHLPATRRGQGQVRPRQRLPPQQEHPPRLSRAWPSSTRWMADPDARAEAVRDTQHGRCRHAGSVGPGLAGSDPGGCCRERPARSRRLGLAGLAGPALVLR